MTNLDQQIEQAVNADNQIAPDRYEELGLWGQLGSLFTGKMAWMSVVTLIVGTVATVGGIYAAWQFIVADDVAAMLQWGALAWSLFVTQMMIKLWSWMRMESNRTIREIKRLELQIALLGDG